jgi:dimethylargininase
MLLDCCFVEDNAIVVEDEAIINYLGAESRRKEVSGVENALKEVMDNINYGNFIPSD